MKNKCVLCGCTNHTKKNYLTKRIGADNTNFNVIKCNNCSLYSLYPIPNTHDIAMIYADYAIQ